MIFDQNVFDNQMAVVRSVSERSASTYSIIFLLSPQFGQKPRGNNSYCEAVNDLKPT